MKYSADNAAAKAELRVPPRFDVTLLDKAGQRRFARTYSGNQVAGGVIALDTGIFASVDDLKAVLEKALSEAVDKALDDPDLRAALQQ